MIVSKILVRVGFLLHSVQNVVCEYLKVVANEDTLLQTQMFPRLPVCATFVADTNFVSESQKMFLIFVRNILCPQQMFPRLRGMDTRQMFCVPHVCPPKKHHEQQCVRNIVSSFAITFMEYRKLISFVTQNSKEY